MQKCMLETVENNTGKNPAWSIIWLHGLGADGHDFTSIVPELLRPGWPSIRFIFPHAKVRPVTINGGMPMRAWYDIVSLSSDERADELGVRESIADIDELIARERDRGIPASRVILAGFSQGGAIALTNGIRRYDGVAGIVALSTYLPLADKTAEEITPAGRTTPIFMAHGTQDSVVTHTWGTRARDALRTLNISVDWHSYPMQHNVCAKEIQDLSDWLTQRFNKI